MAFPDCFRGGGAAHAPTSCASSPRCVSLKKMGTSWKGLCPFHQEKTPSFNVRAEPAVFHCFGCGEGGDVFKFVMLHERVPFPEAIESLARRFGVPVPENRYEPGPDRKEREEMLALMEAAAQHFSRQLWTAPGTKAREYLLGRGFKKETLEKIRAGAARDSWDDLLGALRGKFGPMALLAAGLVLERQGKDGHYDRFRNRAVFPILNESGKVVGFGARSLDGSRAQVPELARRRPVYQKSRTLYGLSWAKDAIRREGRDRTHGGVPGRGPRCRGGDRGGGGDLRHRAHRRARRGSSAASRRRSRSTSTRTRRDRRPRARASTCCSKKGCACRWSSCRRGTTPTAS